LYRSVAGRGIGQAWGKATVKALGWVPRLQPNGQINPLELSEPTILSEFATNFNFEGRGSEHRLSLSRRRTASRPNSTTDRWFIFSVFCFHCSAVMVAEQVWLRHRGTTAA